MIIKSIELNNYCGISHLVCHFKSGVNIIDNADVLKAVYKVINGDFSESPDITAEITPHANQQINTRGSPNETKSFNIFVFRILPYILIILICISILTICIKKKSF